MTEVKQCPICNSENYFSILNTTKTYWPDIERAEIFDEEGNQIFNDLSHIFKEKYFSVKGDGFDLM